MKFYHIISYICSKIRFMKRHLPFIIILLLTCFSLCASIDVFSSNEIKDVTSYVSDEQESDIDFIFDVTNSGQTTLAESYNSLPSPSLRNISSQKRFQHNFTNNISSRRSYSELQTVKRNNTNFSFPLSSEEDLIVIVRHLII